MLLSGQTTVAIRCPQCGKMETASLSRFECSGGHSVRLTCTCGGHKLTAGTKGRQAWLQIPCYLCDGLHFVYFPSRTFWDQKLKPIMCAETELQLGVFGPEEEVAAYARAGGSELDRLLDDAAFGEYFDHPDLMYQVLSHVHTLAEEGNLVCVCGNHYIGVDIFPERLDLTCTVCGAHRTLTATTEAELATLEGMSRIVIGDDSSGRKKGHKK